MVVWFDKKCDESIEKSLITYFFIIWFFLHLSYSFLTFCVILFEKIYFSSHLFMIHSKIYNSLLNKNLYLKLDFPFQTWNNFNITSLKVIENSFVLSDQLTPHLLWLHHQNSNFMFVFLVENALDIFYQVEKFDELLHTPNLIMHLTAFKLIFFHSLTKTLQTISVFEQYQ